MAFSEAHHFSLLIMTKYSKLDPVSHGFLLPGGMDDAVSIVVHANPRLSKQRIHALQVSRPCIKTIITGYYTAEAPPA
jgi:hypothetical protein